MLSQFYLFLWLPNPELLQNESRQRFQQLLKTSLSGQNVFQPSKPWCQRQKLIPFFPSSHFCLSVQSLDFISLSQVYFWFQVLIVNSAESNYLRGNEERHIRRKSHWKDPTGKAFLFQTWTLSYSILYFGYLEVLNFYALYLVNILGLFFLFYHFSITLCVFSLLYWFFSHYQWPEFSC